MHLRRRRTIAALLVALVALVITVVALAGNDDEALPEAGSRFGATSTPTTRAISEPGDAGVEKVLGAPVQDAVTRLFLIGFPGYGPDRPTLKRLARRDWGGVVLERGNVIDDRQVAALVRRVRRAAARGRHQPPLVAAVQTGGAAGAVPGAPPSQARAADAGAAQRQAEEAGRRLRRLGIRMALGPVADIGTAGGAWEGRAFSDDPATVARLTAGAVAGWKAAKVAAAPGHFPGEGAASRDPALGVATVGLALDELRERDGRPFQAISDDAPAIQLSSSTYAAFDGVTPATQLPDVVKLLRDDLGFKGVVVSGDLAAAALATGQATGDVAVEALQAGADLLWVPGDARDQEAAVRAVVAAVRSGKVEPERVAEALKRISLLRASYGVR